MNNTIRRSGYFLLLAAATLFFALHLALGRVFTPISDPALTRSVGLCVMMLTLYVVREYKAFLVSSTPLRVVLGSAGLLGFVVIAGTIASR